jgi:hypothetical protein
MFDDRAAGDLAGVMPAHSVSDDPDTELRLDEVLILVELAYAALVGYRPCVKSKETSVHRSRPE